MKTPAISASAADNMTCRRMEHLDKIGPLRGGSTSGGFDGSDCSVLRKKCPPTLDWDFFGHIGGI